MTTQDWTSFVVSYRTAGELLLENLANWRKQHPEPGLQIYPIIFLYRHYIELSLKDIILESRKYLGVKDSFPSGHDLNCLWRKCRQLIEQIDEHCCSTPARERHQRVIDWENRLEKDIREFVKLDGNSQSSRYPVNKNGTPLDAAEIQKFNGYKIAENLKELVTRISRDLDGLSE